MKKLLYFFLFFVIAIAGYMNYISNQTTENELLESEVLVKATTKLEAIKLARKHLKAEGIDWGEPIKVIWQKNHHRHLVIFSTPDWERGMLGNRGVFVYTEGATWAMLQG